VKNAQDAGAIAAIITLPPLPFPISPGPLAILEGYGGFEAMVSSGNVTAPITIPSVLVESVTGNAIQSNIANSVNAIIGGVDFLSQERNNLGFCFADEFDPDSNTEEVSYLLFRSWEDSNNLLTGSVTVLRDTDSDGIPDLDDPCPNNAAKTAPGVCGCGLADVDNNANGIVDCLSSDELKDKLDRAKKLIKKLKQLKSTGNAKKDKKRRKAQREIKKELKALLAEIVDTVQTPTQAILLLDAGTDLEKLARVAQKKGRRATRTASSNFAAKKKAARRAVKKVQKALA